MHLPLFAGAYIVKLSMGAFLPKKSSDARHIVTQREAALKIFGYDLHRDSFKKSYLKDHKKQEEE